MANYMVGALKIRGQVDKVIEFLNNSVIGIEFYFDDDGKLKINIEAVQMVTYFDGAIETCIEAEDFDGFLNNDIAYICFDEISCRRYFETDYFLKAAQTYGIEFKFHGFDSMREVNQVVEIKDGKVIWDDELMFKDYFWDCLYPFKGG